MNNVQLYLEKKNIPPEVFFILLMLEDKKKKTMNYENLIEPSWNVIWMQEGKRTPPVWQEQLPPLSNKMFPICTNRSLDSL